MTPIIFPSNATTFTTNGLGRLGATECYVEQEVNGIFELEMVVPVDDLRFSEIEMSRIIVAKPSPARSPQAFRIYKISKPINGLVTVNAQHISYQLSYIPVMPYTATSCSDALTKISTNAAETCPFSFSTNKTITANWKSPIVPTSARGILQGEEGSILQRFKGEYEFDNWSVSLKAHLGTNNGVVIRYGKNLIDLLQEESIENTYTGICPYYQSDDYVLTLTEKVLHSANASNFPYQRTLPVDLSDKFNAIPTEQELRDAGNAYITDNNIGVPDVSLDVSFIPLSDTEEYKGHTLENVELGDTVGVYFEKLGVQASAEVISIKYNVLAERYDSIHIGSVKSSLSTTLANQTQEIVSQQTNFEKAVQTATELINGGLGGYVRTTTNSAGQPQEILIMDTDDTATATNVIRMNQNGIGFSTTGYQGPFNSAWTIDGTFDASVINVINLIAHKVQSYSNDNNTLLEIMSSYMDIRGLDNGTWRQRISAFKSAQDGGVIRVSNGLTDANGTPQGASTRTFIYPYRVNVGVDENDVYAVRLHKHGSSTHWTDISDEYIGFRRDSNGSTVYIDGNNADFNSVPINGKYANGNDNGIQAIHGESSKRAGVGAKRSDTGAAISMIVGTGGTNHGIYSDSMSKWMIYADGTDIFSNLSVKQLNSGEITTGNQTLSGAQKFRLLLIYGVAVTGDPTICMMIPTSAIISSDTAYQINNESDFYSFYLKTSGSNNVVITYRNRSSTGKIIRVYGVA